MEVWLRNVIPQHNLASDQWRLVVHIGQNFYFQPESVGIMVDSSPENITVKSGKFRVNFLSDWEPVNDDVPLDKVHHISCLTSIVSDDCDERFKSNNITVNWAVPREWFLYRYPCFCKTGKKCDSDTVFRQKQYQAVASESLFAFWPFDNYFRADEMTKGQPPDYDPEQPNQSNFNIMNFPLIQYQYNWFCIDRICGVQFVRKNEMKAKITKLDMYNPISALMFETEKIPLPKSLFSYSNLRDRYGLNNKVFMLSFFININLEHFEQSDVLGLSPSETHEPWDYFYFRIVYEHEHLYIQVMIGQRQIHKRTLEKCLLKSWCGIVVTFDYLEISIFEIGYGQLSTFTNSDPIEVDSIHIHRLTDGDGNFTHIGNHPGVALGCLSLFNKRLNGNEINQLREACENRGEAKSAVSTTVKPPTTKQNKESSSNGKTDQLVKTTIIPIFTTKPVDERLISLTTIAVVVILLVLLCCACVCVAICRRCCRST